jgi:hypothetical protein
MTSLGLVVENHGKLPDLLSVLRMQVKMFGKIKIYLADQSRFPVPTEEELVEVCTLQGPFLCSPSR